MIRKLLIVLLFAITVFTYQIFAQSNGDPVITVDNLIGALTPLIIFGVTWVVQKIKPTLMGWNIVWVVIPILSFLATVLLQLADLATSFLSQFLWNFLSVVVAQLIIQLSEEKRLQNQAKRVELSDK